MTLIKIIITTAFYLIANNIFAQKDFQLIKEKDGVALYQRDFGSKGIKQYRVRTTFHHCTLGNIIATFRDHEHYHEWMTDLKLIKNIRHVSDIDNYDYYEIIIPWPFKNRDALYHQRMFQDPADKSLHIVFNCEPSHPPVADKVRMTQTQGAWKFTPKGKGEIEVDYINYTDPENIASGVVNMVFSEALFKSITNLRNQLKKDRHHNKKYPNIIEVP